MHLAVALGRPTVALFGPTRPGRTGPYGANVRVIRKDMDCGPCLSRDCRREKIECMHRIAPDEVFEAMRALMTHFQEPT
jgi:ADP-heptose:LPS heptosyltransferase